MPGTTAVDAEALAGKEYIDLSHRLADEEARLAQEFAAQQAAEYRKIRARA